MHKRLTAAAVAAMCLLVGSAWAKLPPPSDEAKAKAAETAAKNAWNGKVANFQLCKAQNAAAEAFFAQARKDGRETRPPVETPACADPGPFVYTPATPVASK